MGSDITISLNLEIYVCCGFATLKVYCTNIMKFTPIGHTTTVKKTLHYCVINSQGL